MHLDSPDAEMQARSDFLVFQPLDKLAQDLSLARGQRVQLMLSDTFSFALAAFLFVDLKAFLDALE